VTQLVTHVHVSSVAARRVYNAARRESASYQNVTRSKLNAFFTSGRGSSSPSEGQRDYLS